MTTEAQFIAWCAGQIGVTEQPPGSNRTPYAAEADLADGLSWCHAFLVAGARETGLGLPPGVAVAGTVYAFEHWQAAGKAGTQGRVGAWGYIHFPEDPPGINHVEVLTAPMLDGSWRTIGGNTSFPGIPASRSKGGAVSAEVRPASFFVGFGYPDYSPPTVTPPATSTSEDGPMQWTAPCLWMPPSDGSQPGIPAGLEPYFVIASGATNDDFVVASINGAPFTPAWVNGFVAPPGQAFQYEDFLYLGLYWRRVHRTGGAAQGPLIHPDHIAVACSGGHDYVIAHQ